MLGVESVTDAAIMAWHGASAEALVLATTNVSQTWLAEALAESGKEIHSIGDCVSPRLAVMAIYEGRELGMRL